MSNFQPQRIFFKSSSKLNEVMDKSGAKRYQYDFDSDFGSDSSTNYESNVKQKMKKRREKKSKSPPQPSTRNFIMAKRRVKKSPEGKENRRSPTARSPLRTKRDLINLSGFEVISPTIKTFKSNALTPLQRSIYTKTGYLANSKSRANSIEMGDRHISKASTSTPHSCRFDIDSEDSPEQPRKRRTFEVNPEDSILLNTSGKKKTKNRTFELDEPCMAENKRKSENFSKSLKNEVKVVFESPWKNVMGADDDAVSEITSNESVSQKITFAPNPSSNKMASAQKNPSKSSLKKTATLDSKLNMLNSNSKSITKSRTKMPNFARIHKNAFEKMDSLEDYAVRKAERAKALMSGSKVQIGRPESENKSVALSKKHLEFETNLGSTIKKQVAFSTPTKKIISTLRFATPNNKSQNSPQNFNTPQKFNNELITKKPSVQSLQNTPKKINTPQKFTSELNTIKSSVQSFRNTAPKFKATPKKIKTPPKSLPSKKQVVVGDCKSKDSRFGKSNKTIGLKEKNVVKTFKELKAVNNQLGVVLPGRGLKLSPRKKVSPKKHVVNNKLNYKANVIIKESKDDLIKAVAAKRPVTKDAVNERRALIKGVRSNRRFDLLMNMRKLNK